MCAISSLTSSRSLSHLLMSSCYRQAIGGYTVMQDSATPNPRLPSQPQITATVPWPVIVSNPFEGRRLSCPGWLVM